MLLSDISINLTEEILDDIIKKNGGVKHISWELGTGFKKGDSYLSDCYRMFVYGEKVDGEKFMVPVVIKTSPKHIGRRKSFRTHDFFRNEYNFYVDILPAFVKFQNDRNPKNPFTEFPTFYAGFIDGENDLIILGDLLPLGFAAPVRQHGLDLIHARKIMETLGRYHGLSYAMKDQEPEKFQSMADAREEVYYALKFKEWYNPFLVDQIVVATDAIEKEYGGTIVEQKMKEFTSDKDKLYATMASLVCATNEYSIIGHGDGWPPNFLMSYEEVDGKKVPTKIKLIDYQLTRYSSPAIDISFFIYACTTQSLREAHYDELLRAYYTSLSDLLRDLGSDPDKVFPYTALLSEMKRCGRFGVGMSMESIPLSMMDDDDAVDVSLLEGDEPFLVTKVWIIHPIKTKEGRLRLADTYKHAIEQGYFTQD